MKITLGTTYYNCPEELKLFISRHIDYVDELIVVDDGSQIYPALDYLIQQPKLKLYRVKKDYGFNSHGCRNLIMKEAENDWVILLDIDRKFMSPKEDIENIKSRKLKQNVLYRFIAMISYNKPDYDTVHKSVNDFLIHRDHFFSAGGYDEELIGMRMGDREYFKQLEFFGSEYLINEVTIALTRQPTIKSDRHSQKIIKSQNDTRKIYWDVKRRVDNRLVKPDPNKPILTFDWEKVF